MYCVFYVCYCVMQQEPRRKKTRREALISYLKPPGVTNNMVDNTVSSPSHGLGFIASHVC